MREEDLSRTPPSLGSADDDSQPSKGAVLGGRGGGGTADVDAFVEKLLKHVTDPHARLMILSTITTDSR